MRKSCLMLLLILVFPACLLAQQENDESLSEQQISEIMSQIGFDSTAFLREVSKGACQCIDSVEHLKENKAKTMEGIAACIEERVISYQLMVQLAGSMKSGKLKNEILLATDKSSSQYKTYYYQIERWLKDSCKVLTDILSSDDEAKEKSISGDADARAAYTKGVEYLREQNYSEAIPWFEKALDIDSVFVFAWDNLGICYRRLEQYEKAVSAYKESLKLDPSAKTALQNLAVAYQLQNKNEEAITTYKTFLQYYPQDPEVYYGLALVYFNNLKDMENALQNACKAYNIYVDQKSAYRSDAEKVINLIYSEMKKNNREDEFFKILSENNIKTN